MTQTRLDNRSTALVAALLLALGIILGGYLLGDGLRRARMADRSVTVRGLAERNVNADLATWNITFSAQGNDLGPVQAEIDRDARAVASFFQSTGFPADAVTDSGGSVNQYFDSSRGENVVTINRRVQLRTNDVMRARRAHARQFELIRNGVAIQEGSQT